MALEYRPIREEEYHVAIDAGEASFGEVVSDDDLELIRGWLPWQRILAAFDGASPVGMVAGVPLELTVPGAVVPACGVTWVGVLPTHRRRGILSTLETMQLADAHERGEPLAALWASEAAIYGRYGYGIAAPSGVLEATRAGFELRDDPGPSGSVRLVTQEEALELIPPIYERIRTVRPGFVSRSAGRWAMRLGDPEAWRQGAGPRFYGVLELGGEPAGYLTYRIASKWEQGLAAGTLRVGELLGTTDEATRELWRFAFGHDLVTTVQMDVCDPATPLFLLVRDPRRLRLRLNDGLWVRLVDVGEALRRRGWGSPGSVVLEVADAVCPWNAGRYRAGEAAGPTAGPAELRLGVADLASAYLGAFTFEALAAAGRVQELVPGALARATAVFRTERLPSCPEVF